MPVIADKDLGIQLVQAFVEKELKPVLVNFTTGEQQVLDGTRVLDEAPNGQCYLIDESGETKW
eukprot:4322918-Lingulodinium_polyedra.AAC.1